MMGAVNTHPSISIENCTQKSDNCIASNLIAFFEGKFFSAMFYPAVNFLCLRFFQQEPVWGNDGHGPKQCSELILAFWIRGRKTKFSNGIVSLFVRAPKRLSIFLFILITSESCPFASLGRNVWKAKVKIWICFMSEFPVHIEMFPHRMIKVALRRAVKI